MSAWEQLIDEPALLDLVNVWLSDRKRLNTPFRLEVRDLFPLQQLRRQIISASQETKDSIKLEDLNRVFDAATRVAVPDLALIDQRTGVSVSHRDVGLGISQILPVLVHCYAKEREILAIEQPEIHLHPSLQAELTDVFIQSALGEQRNTFLLETHSEHLILRLLRRVRETTDGRLPAGMPPVRPEDVSVLYVQPGENGAEVIEMPVTPDGDFARPWPGGFFAERLEELP